MFSSNTFAKLRNRSERFKNVDHLPAAAVSAARFRCIRFSRFVSVSVSGPATRPNRPKTVFLDSTVCPLFLAPDVARAKRPENDLFW